MSLDVRRDVDVTQRRRAKRVFKGRMSNGRETPSENSHGRSAVICGGGAVSTWRLIWYPQWPPIVWRRLVVLISDLATRNFGPFPRCSTVCSVPSKYASKKSRLSQVFQKAVNRSILSSCINRGQMGARLLLDVGQRNGPRRRSPCLFAYLW